MSKNDVIKFVVSALAAATGFWLYNKWLVKFVG